MSKRIYLSPPHMSGKELDYIHQAFADNWIAPVGPQLKQFELDFCAYTGAEYAVALSSGTAALHLALMVSGVKADDDVLVSTLTFAGSVNPILYIGAKPVFIDSEAQSWNLDPNLLDDYLKQRAKKNRLPAALIPVHLYGQSADMNAITEICNRYEISIIEDAAESLGASYHNQHTGTFGQMGVFSFNGNKIITTSGGGMLVSNQKDLIDYAQKLATQAREPVIHYEHTEIGYNYRMSNIVAAIGCGQLPVIDKRVKRKREIFEYYQSHLGDLPGITFVDEVPRSLHSRWLSVMLIDVSQAGINPEQIRLVLEENNIESRPMWKPMHQQPIFKGYEVVGGSVADHLFEQGLCLPSGTALTRDQLERIVSIIRDLWAT